MEPEKIISVRNPKIKRLLELQQKSSERRESGLFVVEGRRELERCISAGFRAETVFICPDYCQIRESVFAQAGSSPQIFELTKEVYGRIAYRGGTEGVIAEVRAKYPLLEDLKLKPNPLLVVLESVEKPGNLGAVLRSADAAGADAVLVCDPLTDIYNPNTIRASLGTSFSVRTVACTTEEAINWLKGRGIRIFTAQLQDSSYYYNADMKTGCALVMGNEASGLSAPWRKAADARIKIPMLGIADSLNVSVSTAILLFEAVRQRQNAK